MKKLTPNESLKKATKIVAGERIGCFTKMSRLIKPYVSDTYTTDTLVKNISKTKTHPLNLGIAIELLTDGKVKMESICPHINFKGLWKVLDNRKNK